MKFTTINPTYGVKSVIPHKVILNPISLKNSLNLTSLKNILNLISLKDILNSTALKILSITTLRPLLITTLKPLSTKFKGGNRFEAVLCAGSKFNSGITAGAVDWS
jgi:hypothetical protein